MTTDRCVRPTLRGSVLPWQNCRHPTRRSANIARWVAYICNLSFLLHVKYTLSYRIVLSTAQIVRLVCESVEYCRFIVSASERIQYRYRYQLCRAKSEAVWRWSRSTSGQVSTEMGNCIHAVNDFGM